MKIKHFILLLLILLVFGCQKKNAYQIHGTVTGFPSEKSIAYLTQRGLIISEGWQTIDSVQVKDGKFEFKGELKNKSDIYSIKVSGYPKAAQFILEPGSTYIDFNMADIKISGNVINDDFDKYIVSGNLEDRIYFINKYIEQPAIATLVFELIAINHESLDSIYPKLSEELKERLKKEKIVWDKGYKEVEKKLKLEEEKNTPEAVRTGKPYTDFKAESSDGSTLRLSDIRKGKRLVLLDFWASWCNPCMKEMPNIIQIYKDYKGKGLEIVGISLDRNKEAWTKAIEKNQMKWIQLIDTEEPANENVSELYHVKAIPYTILIDSTGTIVARNFRGEELRETIEKLLK